MLINKISKWNSLRLAARRERKIKAGSIAYGDWVREFAVLSGLEEDQLLAKMEVLRDEPKFSIVMPIYNPVHQHVKDAIKSVKAQIYKNWELCIADDASSDPAIRGVLLEAAQQDERIKVVFREANGHISQASNSAIELATGGFLVFMDQDDLLSNYCLAALAVAVNNNPHASIIYSDEDKIDSKGSRKDPHFKPEWNELLLRSQNYMGHVCAIEYSLVRSVGGFRVGFEGAQDHDLLLRCAEMVGAGGIVHIPLVLYHWRLHKKSTASGASAKPYALTAGQAAVQEHINRKGLLGLTLVDGIYYRTKYSIAASPPSVSIIIPTKDKPDLLDRCVRSIISNTSYRNVRIVLVDNGTTDKRALFILEEFSRNPRCSVVRDDGPFNYSAINNKAVASCSAEYICLMNNDIESIQSDWLDEMLSVCSQPGIGAVGARLYYPSGLIQHAGVITGVTGVAGHQFKYQKASSGNYMCRSKLMQELSAVTAACMLVRRDVFIRSGGLDEDNLPVAYNDIDLCLKIRALGYKVAYNPYAEFIHHESSSRGHDSEIEGRERLVKEAAFMESKWGGGLKKDPAYNPNLTLDHEQYGLASAPRFSLQEYFGLD